MKHNAKGSQPAYSFLAISRTRTLIATFKIDSYFTCKFLQAEGYEPSPTDPCVMRKIVDGCIFLLLIYVNDILLFADLDEIKWME
jgi:hypothetical protein